MYTYHGAAATPMETVPAGSDDARWLLAGDEPED